MKLNIGCGVEAKDGYVNLDKYRYKGVDIVHDLEKPLPFGEGTFDEIYADCILEHIQNLSKLMLEIHRVLKKGGVLRLRIPHFTYRNSFMDITHVRTFSIFSLGEFVVSDMEQGKLYGFRRFNGIKRYLEFESRPLMFWNYILEGLVNLNGFTQNLYERTPLRIFPATLVYMELRK